MKMKKEQAMEILTEALKIEGNGYRAMNIMFLKAFVNLKGIKIFKNSFENYDFCFTINGITFGIQLKDNTIKIANAWHCLNNNTTHNFLECMLFLIDKDNLLIQVNSLKNL